MDSRKSDETSEKEIQTPKVTEKDRVLNLIRVKMEGVTFPVDERSDYNELPLFEDERHNMEKLNEGIKKTNESKIMWLLKELDSALDLDLVQPIPNETEIDKANRRHNARLEAMKEIQKIEPNRILLLQQASELRLQQDLRKTNAPFHHPFTRQPLAQYLSEFVIGPKITGESMVAYFEKIDRGKNDNLRKIYGAEIYEKALKDAMESKRKDLSFLINESVKSENEGAVAKNLEKYIKPQPKSFPRRFFSAVQAFFTPGKSVKEAFRQEEDFTVDQKAKDFIDRLEGLTYSADMQSLIREVVENLEKYPNPDNPNNEAERKNKLIESLDDSVRLMKMILDSIPDPIPDPISQFKKSFEVFKEGIILSINQVDKILGVEVKETVENRLNTLDSERAEALAEALAQQMNKDDEPVNNQRFADYAARDAESRAQENAAVDVLGKRPATHTPAAAAKAAAAAAAAKAAAKAPAPAAAPAASKLKPGSGP